MRHANFVLILMLCSLSCSDEKTSNVKPFQIRWQQEYDYLLSSMMGTSVNDKSLVALDNMIWVIDNDSGEQLYPMQTAQTTGIVGARNILQEEGSVYVATAKHVSCYDFDNGELLWQHNFPVQEEYMLLTEMHLYDDRLIVAKLNGCFILDKKNGGLIHEVDLKHILELPSPPTEIRVRDAIPVDDDHIAFAVELSDPNIPEGGGIATVIDVRDDRPLWSYHTVLLDSVSGAVPSAPGVTKMDIYEDNLVFLNNDVSVVDVYTGEIRWHYQVDKPTPGFGTLGWGFFYGLEVSQEDGTVYLGAVWPSATIFALNMADGSEKWSSEVGVPSIRHMMETDDHIVALGEHIWFVDKETGRLDADLIGNTGDRFYVFPIIGDNEIIGTSSQRVYCWEY